MPPLKPLAAPKITMAAPVNASYPNVRAIIIPIGTKIIVSSAKPIVKPKIEKAVIVKGIIKKFALPNVLIALLTPFSNAPVLCTIPNAPPTKNT